MRNKFEIIEEGRLNKSEMNQVIGGVNSCNKVLSCSPARNYNADQSCEHNSGLSTCPRNYVSCSSNAPGHFITCSAMYGGPTVPMGNEIFVPSFNLNELVGNLELELAVMQ